jgi:hypothetical protein
MDTTMDELTPRFAAGLAEVACLLTGGDAGALAGDPAVARLQEWPIPVLSAASSVTAARRAAACDVGLVFDSLSTPERCRELVDAYRAAGGTHACVLVRRAWIGEPPIRETARQLDTYRGYAPAGASAHWGADELAAGTDARDVARHLAGAVRTAGVDALNIRVHVPGVSPADAREQIAALGTRVMPLLRAEVAWNPGGAEPGDAEPGDSETR